MIDIDQAMELAIAEAYKGAPFVSPNPLVGCVILDKSGNLLSVGCHQRYGEAHAEVNALKGLSDEQLQGAHVIVTLEPCAHEGKTPSCAKALAKLPIAKVTYGLVDPNPLVSGQGAEILKQAGIAAELYGAHASPRVSEIQSALEEVCEVFLWNFRQKKVFVALKMASSLDGMVAHQNGESKWITGPQAREYVHYLRACYDAVLVGRGTVHFDNPTLNVRHPHIDKKNKVVVIDPSGSLLAQKESLNIFKEHEAGNIFWCVREGCEAAKSAAGVQIISVGTRADGSLNLEDLLAKLYAQGIRSVMVEGGADTASHFLQASLVNRLWLFMAPVIIGSGTGVSWTKNMKINHIKDRFELKHVKSHYFGPDLCWTGRLKF